MQTLITRPTIADVSNINEMVAYLCLEIKSAKDKQETLFKKAIATEDFFEREAIMKQADRLITQESDLTKHMHSVHYQALEDMGDDGSIFIPTQLAA